MSDTSQRREQTRQRNQVIAKALRNRDETRRKLLAQGRKLARRRAENIDHGSDCADQATQSTNVSAYSTMPSMESNEAAAARHSHSTVPAQPKGSTVPAADRLYGLSLYERLYPKGDANGGSRDTEATADESTAHSNEGEGR